MSRPTALPFAALPARAWHAPARVRFSDCDPAGIVFFANWFTFANAAIEDWFDHALNVDFHDLHGPRRTGTGFAHAEADYFAPGMMGDRITLTPLITRIGGASYSLTVHIHRGETELARLSLVTATTDLDARRAIPIPDDLRAALVAYRDLCAA
ncbi:acyl-CoA thioesterase [Humitalea sp. 24SJ18S-53]|uniref:acyl-CoA thioesterase n=1 Tax=Humitalea sp. 24SJ18S-53 TaxID=3422307 RepID=UPI003D6753C6